ncbi:hypothetical protein PPTG_22870 [Phytophthora nicotianae INRA-310]|uniref:Uncharacterized protein n=1 Tax=Phytophthora nicotianae (strain INRA-310) TaxID=761204 RepID=W2Q903_PHYN3|nr:hypothetical protein PPTG_22870 [Phytophthora nicotianae INRA-310]ETN09331.1 hypothetical protein PPTG_22870 [Phytophthora nicotianae INRA-310]
MMTANRGHAAAKDMLRLIVAKQLTSIDDAGFAVLLDVMVVVLLDDVTVEGDSWLVARASSFASAAKKAVPSFVLTSLDFQLAYSFFSKVVVEFP